MQWSHLIYGRWIFVFKERLPSCLAWVKYLLINTHLALRGLFLIDYVLNLDLAKFVLKFTRE